MSTPCHIRHAPGQPVRTEADAVRAVRLATDDGRDRCVVVATVDSDRRPLTMLIFDEPSDDGDLEAAVEAVTNAITDIGTTIDAMFLASSRPGREPGPTAEDEERWFRMLDVCSDVGIELLDWFLLSDGAVCSVAVGLLPGPAW
jgi:hypothetical protein